MISVVILVVIILSCVVALLSVVILHLHATTIRALAESHARTTEHTEGLVDRIIAGDYATYKAYEMMEQPEADVEETIEEAVERVRGPDRGGFGSRLGLAAYHPPDEESTETEDEMRSEIP